MERYNGWSNYPTWRVMLEVFDGMDSRDIENAEHAKEFAHMVIDHAFDDPSQYSGGRVLVEGWARAWLSEVNWDEIAAAVRENVEE